MKLNMALKKAIQKFLSSSSYPGFSLCRILQNLKLLFRWLSRTKLILKDFSRPGKSRKKQLRHRNPGVLLHRHIWLPGLRPSARVTPQRTSTTALFDYISAGRSTHCVLPLAIAPFQRLLHRSGTVCRSRSGRLRRCKFSAADWKPNFSPGLTVMTNNVSLHWLLLRDFTV